MSVSSRLDVENVISKNDETLNDEDFEAGHFPALKPNYDRGERAHHMVTGHTASRNSFPSISHADFKLKKANIATIRSSAKHDNTHSTLQHNANG